MRIAAYCRVSTEKEEQLDSLTHQKEFFEQYAAKNGCDLVEIYADEGISGTSLKKRDAFLRLLSDAEAGRFDLVVVKDVSRLARNTVDFLQSIRALKRLGVATRFLTANMDSLGESEFVLTLFGAMAQEESANLSKRVKFGKELTAQKGRVPQRIFGYDRLDNYHLAINLREAQVVREIFRLYLEEGLGCRTISRRLNDQGCRTKYDCLWNPRAVGRILQNSIYCGEYINHKYEIQDFLTGKQVCLPKEQHLHHPRPEWAIIPPETFHRAQQQLASRRSVPRYSGKYPFSNLIRCSHCGKCFCRKQYTYAQTRTYWKCSSNETSKGCENKVTVDEVPLLAAIQTHLSAAIPDRIAFSEAIANARQQPLRANTREKQLLAQKARYQEMYANEVMTMEELKVRLTAVEKELKKEMPKDRYLPIHVPIESVTNQELRQLIDHIAVEKTGDVHIFFRTLPV